MCLTESTYLLKMLYPPSSATLPEKDLGINGGNSVLDIFHYSLKLPYLLPIYVVFLISKSTWTYIH